MSFSGVGMGEKTAKKTGKFRKKYAGIFITLLIFVLR